MTTGRIFAIVLDTFFYRGNNGFILPEVFPKCRCSLKIVFDFLYPAIRIGINCRNICYSHFAIFQTPIYKSVPEERYDVKSLFFRQSFLALHPQSSPGKRPELRSSLNLIRAQIRSRFPSPTPKRSPYRAPFKNNPKSAVFWQSDKLKRSHRRV